MAALALPASDLLRVVTITDRAGKPAWEKMFDWPRFGDADLGLGADSAARRNIWATQLDRTVADSDRPVLLVAHGAGCFATAWWARLTPKDYVSRVAGALLFKPLEGGAAGARRARSFASPRIALPFPSIVIGNDNDQGRSAEQIRAIAESWGSRLLEDGGSDDLLPGASKWRNAQRMIERLTASVVEQRMRAAEAFGLSQ